MERLGPISRTVIATTLLGGSLLYLRGGDSSAYANSEQPTPIVTPDTLGFGTHLGQIVFINNGTPTVEANALAVQATATPTGKVEYLRPVGIDIPTATATPTATVEEDDSKQRERQNRGNTQRRREKEDDEPSDKSSGGKNNQNNSRNGDNNNDNNGNDNDERVCGQALTTGYNPQTGETRVFPTTCLPDGWVRVGNEKATSTPTPSPTPQKFCPAEFPSRCGTPSTRPTITPTPTSIVFCPATEPAVFPPRCGTPQTRLTTTQK